MEENSAAGADGRGRTRIALQRLRPDVSPGAGRIHARRSQIRRRRQRAAYRTILDLLDCFRPPLKPRVYKYSGTKPIFEFYGVEEQIDRSLQRKVWLDSGGYIIIDHTEALTSMT